MKLCKRYSRLLNNSEKLNKTDFHLYYEIGVLNKAISFSRSFKALGTRNHFWLDDEMQRKNHLIVPFLMPRKK